MAHRHWKIILFFSLGGGSLFLISAGLLAATIRALDLSIHDRYFVIYPSRLLLVSAVLFLVALIIWKTTTASRNP